MRLCRVVCLLMFGLMLPFPAASRADDRWVDSAQVGIFQIQSEFPLTETPGLTQMLQQLQQDVIEQLGIPMGERPVEVLLFRGQWSYKRYLAQRVPEGTSRRALFVQGPDVGWVYAYKSSSFEVDLRHEATHALLHAVLPFVPLWLDEGLAEYFEITSGERAEGHPHRRGVGFASRFGWKPNLDKLEAETEFHNFDNGDYRAAWSVVHFCLHGSAIAREELRSYLDDVASGVPTQPFGARLKAVLPDVERQIGRHHR